MAKYNGKTVIFEGATYVITGYHYGFQMFEVREVGRNFRTLIPSDETSLFE